MNRKILLIIVVLTLGYLMEVPRAQDLMVVAASLYLLVGGVIWLTTQKLPQGFILNLILIALGPLVLVMIMNVALGAIHELPGHGPAAVLLLIIIASAFVGMRLLRRKSR